MVATVRLGKRPRGIRVSPDHTTLYVALSGSPFAPPGVDEKSLPPPDRSADGIGVVDVAQMRLVKVIPAGTDPEQLAVSKDGASLFIANEDAATASVLDVARGRVVATVPVSKPHTIATSLFTSRAGRRPSAARSRSPTPGWSSAADAASEVVRDLPISKSCAAGPSEPIL